MSPVKLRYPGGQSSRGSENAKGHKPPEKKNSFVNLGQAFAGRMSRQRTKACHGLPGFASSSGRVLCFPLAV